MVTIYHNARCSKSRQTLALLQEQGVDCKVVEYLKTPLTAEILTSLVTALNLDSPRQLMRTKEAEYKSNGLDDPELSDADLIDAMIKMPKLMERPIVTNHGKAAIGRPPEAVLAIL